MRIETAGEQSSVVFRVWGARTCQIADVSVCVCVYVVEAA